eukprot:1196161-Prorocentrum_minimum.AAC.5
MFGAVEQYRSIHPEFIQNASSIHPEHLHEVDYPFYPTSEPARSTFEPAEIAAPLCTPYVSSSQSHHTHGETSLGHRASPAFFPPYVQAPNAPSVPLPKQLAFAHATAAGDTLQGQYASTNPMPTLWPTVKAPAAELFGHQQSSFPQWTGGHDPWQQHNATPNQQAAFSGLHPCSWGEASGELDMLTRLALGSDDDEARGSVITPNGNLRPRPSPLVLAPTQPLSQSTRESCSSWPSSSATSTRLQPHQTNDRHDSRCVVSEVREHRDPPRLPPNLQSSSLLVSGGVQLHDNVQTSVLPAPGVVSTAAVRRPAAYRPPSVYGST